MQLDKEIACRLTKRAFFQIMNRPFIQFKSIDNYCDYNSKLTHFLSESINTEETLNMNLYSRARYLKGSFYKAPKAYTVHLKNVIYDTISGAIKLSSNQIIENSISTGKDYSIFGIRDTYFPQYKQLECFDGAYSVFRSKFNGYYHTIVDNIPRLFLLRKDNMFSKIKLLCPDKISRIESFYLEKILTNKFELVTVKSGFLYHLDDLLFPSFLTSSFSGYLHKQYIQEFLDLFKPKRPRKRLNRIFISRPKEKRLSKRTIINEDELYEYLSKNGFKKYSLEKLPMEEQIELFYDAEYVVGAHGAGLTNILFSKNASVLELFPSSYIVPHFYYLAKSSNNNYTYCCSSAKHIHSSFHVNIDDVSNALEKLGLKCRKLF
jgi:hypothetical protein